MGDEGTTSEGAPVRSYRDLQVWQFAMSLAERCYEVTSRFPKEETYVMSSQMRRATISIAANIAEGYGRGSTNGYIQFLRIAQGSNRELETHVLLASRIKLLDEQSAAPLLEACDRISRMLNALIRSLEARKDARH